MRQYQQHARAGRGVAAREGEKSARFPQMKSGISRAEDRYEHEADRVADSVVKGIGGTNTPPPSITPLSGARPQRMQNEDAPEREEEVVQAKSREGGARPPLDPSSIRTGLGSGRPLDAGVRETMGASFGRDFSGVRIHDDSRGAGISRRLNARAFTVGDHVAFGSGEYRPGTERGNHLIAHELTHVVQQRGAAYGGAPQFLQRQGDEGFDPGEYDDIKGYTAEEVEEYGASTKGIEDNIGDEAEKDIRGMSGTRMRKPGRISRDGGQNMLKVPSTLRGTNVIRVLSFNEMIFVEEMDKYDYYRIVSSKGERGWVPKTSVALDPPEPGAELYRVISGDKAINLVARWYKPASGFDHWWEPGSKGEGDARFYVSALAFANKGRAGMPSPGDLTKRDAWKNVKLVEGMTIWKPSVQFLNALKGKVSSGSITREIWENVKAVAKIIFDWIVYAASFIGGVLYGALESLYDLLAGAVDLVKMLWDVIVSIITGNIFSDAEALWNDIKNFDPSAVADDFSRKWNASNPIDQAFFRGRVIGYVVMEVIMLFVSAGTLTAIKWAGKFAKAASFLKKFKKVAQVISKVEKGVKEAKIVQKFGKKVDDLQNARHAGKLNKQMQKVTKGVEKGRPAIETFLKSQQHLQERASAWAAYVKKGGKKSKATWEKMYDTLTRNRKVGKLAEEQFELVMGGKKKTFEMPSGTRYVDNYLNGVAREVKSGYTKLTPFIKRQIVKDVELIKLGGVKVEWHLLAGADSKVIAVLQKAGIKVVLY